MIDNDCVRTITEKDITTQLPTHIWFKVADSDIMAYYYMFSVPIPNSKSACISVWITKNELKHSKNGQLDGFSKYFFYRKFINAALSFKYLLETAIPKGLNFYGELLEND